MTTLTRGQLEALASLHRLGHLIPRRPGAHRRGATLYSRRTLDALVAGGVARWMDDGVPDYGPPVAVPMLRTWADGNGAWHVEIPRDLRADDDTTAGYTVLGSASSRTLRRAVARAVIRGEVAARQGDQRPVIRVAPDGIGIARPVVYYKEV